MATSSNGSVYGVMVNGTLDLSQANDASVTVYNGFVLNGTLRLGKADGSMCFGVCCDGS